MNENALARIAVDATVTVHRELGPGLFESAYEQALCFELEQRDLAVVTQVPVPILYRGNRIAEGFRADMIVEQRLLLELKSVERLERVHKKQLLTYLRLSGIKLGLLLNFGEPLMKNGILRMANNLHP